MAGRKILIPGITSVHSKRGEAADAMDSVLQIEFAFKSACTHLGLQTTQWRLELHDRLDVSNASMQLQRFERREIERPTRDPRTGAVMMRRVMTEVPVVVDHRLDTATALRLHLRRIASNGQSDSSSTSTSAADALIVEVGVSMDANRIMSLTRVTAAPSQNLPRPTSAGAAAPRAPGQLRVLSFNIWNFNFWWYRKELALKEITVAQADVVGFQEVRVARESRIKRVARVRSQVTALAGLLPGWQFVWVPAMTFAEGGQEYHAEGLAVFSRHPIVDSSFVRLSRNTQDAGDFHQRLCLRAQLAVPGFGRTESADIFVTHLSLSQEARARTLPEIRRYVAEHARTRPAVLVGDFNGEVGPLDFAGANSGVAADADSASAASARVVGVDAAAESEPALIDLWTHTPPERRWIGHANSPTAHTLRSAAAVDKSSCVAAPAMSGAADASSAGVGAAQAPMQALSVGMDRLAPVSAPSGSIRISPSKMATSCSDSPAASSSHPTVAKLTSAASIAAASSSESASACADSSSASLSASWDPALEWTFSAWRPRSRIDYCFGAGAVRAVEMRLLGVDATPVDELRERGLLGHEGAGGVDSIDGVMYASDHRLLLAVVEAL